MYFQRFSKQSMSLCCQIMSTSHGLIQYHHSRTWWYENDPEQYWYLVQDFLAFHWKQDKEHTQLYFYQYHSHLWTVYTWLKGKRLTDLGTIICPIRYHSYDPIEFWMKIILNPIDTHKIFQLQSHNITRLPTIDLWSTILWRWFGSLAHLINLSENKKSKFRSSLILNCVSLCFWISITGWCHVFFEIDDSKSYQFWKLSVEIDWNYFDGE